MTDPGQEKWIPEDVKDLVDPSLHLPENKTKDERKRSVPYLFALRSEIRSKQGSKGWDSSLGGASKDGHRPNSSLGRSRTKNIGSEGRGPNVDED